MSTESRAELIEEITALILSGNKRTTAANVRAILNKLTNACLNLNDDSSLLGGGGLNAWVSTKTYRLNDPAVISANVIWLPTGTSTNEVPGSGSNWAIKALNTSPYGAGWASSITPGTQAATYGIVETLERLDGSYPWEGDHDASGYQITGLSKLRRSDNTLIFDLDNSAAFAPNGTDYIFDMVNGMSMYTYINMNGYDIRKVSLVYSILNRVVWDAQANAFYDTNSTTVLLDVYGKKLLGGWSIPGLVDYANDAAAGVGGVQPDKLYRTGGAVMVKL